MNRNLKGILLCTFLAMLPGLAACVTDHGLEGDEATPVCERDAQCRAMWNGARIWLARNVPFDLRVNSDDRLVTHRANDDPNLWAEVERVPLGDGRYEIVAEIRCGVVGACHPSPFEALKQFNRYVRQSYKTFD